MRCPFCGADNIQGTELCQSCGSDLAGLDLPEEAGGIAGRLMTDKIASLDMTSPITLGPDETVEAAILAMREARHGCVQITDGEELIGIFSERDVLARVICPGLDPAAIELRQVMTWAPTTLTVNNPPAFAIHRMVSQGFRHLPILDSGELKGTISVRDILRYLDREFLAGAEAD